MSVSQDLLVNTLRGHTTLFLNVVEVIRRELTTIFGIAVSNLAERIRVKRIELASIASYIYQLFNKHQGPSSTKDQGPSSAHDQGSASTNDQGSAYLTCFEFLCREVRKRQLLDFPEYGIPTRAPSMEFGQHERQVSAHPGKFNVDSPYQFGLELWKAAQLFDSKLEHGERFVPTVPPHIHVPETLLVGRDGASLYLTETAKGSFPAANVRGVTLYKMTQRVSAISRIHGSHSGENMAQEVIAVFRGSRLGHSSLARILRSGQC